MLSSLLKPIFLVYKHTVTDKKPLIKYQNTFPESSIKMKDDIFPNICVVQEVNNLKMI